MKPKDLPALYTWETRRPYLHDGVLCVPQYYDKHHEWEQPSWESIFDRAAPLHVEFCSGNGEWIADKAEMYPEINWIAVEMQYKRVRKIWSKKKNRSLNNLLVVCGLAEDFSEHYLSDGEVDAVYVNFPDPWPKDRHAKHRIIQSPFANMMAKILKDEGSATLVTDDETYRDQMIQVMQGNCDFYTKAPAPYYTTEEQSYGQSYFKRLWLGKGKTIHYMNYQREKRMAHATV